jgi:protein-tyrosine phosphatase
MAEWMLAGGLVHFVASDGHGTRRRRPLLGAAYARVAELAGEQAALELCCHHPAAVAAGVAVAAGRRAASRRPSGWRRLFPRKAG